jgi:hypothetical protein
VPIRIVESPEPRSEAARYSDVRLVESDAARLLKHELRRYCNREITGRSFLIAGHRGAGKTTMVENAWLDAWKGNRETDKAKKLRLRPLYVLLHGPSLFPDEALIADVKDLKRADGEGAAANKEASSGAQNDKKAGGSDSKATTKAPASDDDSQTKSETPSNKNKDPIQLALEQMILALHRAAAAEFARGFWDRMTSARPGDSPRRTRRRQREMQPELAAQFQVDLSECPSPARLREFFSHADVLNLGVLDGMDGTAEGIGSVGSSALPFTQGARELVALSGVCEAYRRISGTFKLEETLKDEAKRAAEASASLDSTSTKLVQSVLSVVAGGALGVQVAQVTNSVGTGAVTGLITALGASLILKASFARSRTRSATRAYSFLFDLTIDTLDRVLPTLIDRLLAAGLAPVFVVDELDKVEDLNKRLLRMVNQLKKLVAESAFFCFLTDRLYFEQMAARQHQLAYPVEYTYFTHRLYVVFRATDCHSYLDRILEIEPGPTADGGTVVVMPTARSVEIGSTADSVVQMATAREVADRGTSRSSAPDERDREVLPWVILHRARLHTVDVRRLLLKWRAPNGHVRLPTGGAGEVRTQMAYRLDVLVQVAIEAVLEGNSFRALLTNDPDTRRLAHDAMYYITRTWVGVKRSAQPTGLRSGTDAETVRLDLSDEPAAIKKFEDHLRDRFSKEKLLSVKEGKAPSRRRSKESAVDEPEPDLLASVDVGFLYARVRELAQLLSNPMELGLAVEGWQRDVVERNARIEPALRGDLMEPEIPSSVLETIRLERPKDQTAPPATPAGDQTADMEPEPPLQLLARILDRGGQPTHRYYWRFNAQGDPLAVPGEAPPQARDTDAEWERDAEIIDAWAGALQGVAA